MPSYDNFLDMDTGLLKNPAREKIVLTLKKNGNMSVDDLSREINITPMGVRQHLLVLERNGIVEYITKKHGVGRPGFLYKLTESADDIFPKAYHEFALNLLIYIENTDGKDRINEIFRIRYKRILAEKTRLLSGRDNLSGRVHALAEILQKDGCIVELEEHSGFFRLKQFNCTISKIACRFKEACNYDLQLFKKIIGEDVLREQCLSDGDQACVYVIPKKLEEN